MKLTIAALLVSSTLAQGPSGGSETCDADDLFGFRCCTGFFDGGNKVASCDTSSCRQNFDKKDNLCANHFPGDTVAPNKPKGSANCPYLETDQPICDTSFYNQLNGTPCRNNPDSGNGQNMCLGKVKCGSTGVLFPPERNADSYGTDQAGLDGIVDFGLCNAAAEAAGVGAGTDCFYTGNADNFKVCTGKYCNFSFVPAG